VTGAPNIDQPLQAFELKAQLLGTIHRPPPRRLAIVRTTLVFSA